MARRSAALPLPAPVERADLDGIERRARAATPGPWHREEYEDGDQGEGPTGVYPGSRGPIVEGNDVSGPIGEEGYDNSVAHCYSGHDAAHIAGMDPTTTLRLVAELRGALAEVERLTRERDAARAEARDLRAVVEALRDVGQGTILHDFAGACPDPRTEGPESAHDRDNLCPACAVLLRADAALSRVPAEHADGCAYYKADAPDAESMCDCKRPAEPEPTPEAMAEEMWPQTHGEREAERRITVAAILAERARRRPR